MTPYPFASPWRDDVWASFDELRRSLDDAFGRWGEARGRGGSTGVYPPINLYETTDAYFLSAELPGVKAEDLEISLEGNRLTLRGERKIEHPADPKTSLHRRERPSGIFRRTLELPAAMDADKTEAVCRHGILMLRIPKAPESRPRTISVRAG